MPSNQTQNSIGDLGELIAAVFLSRKTARGFLFQTTLIGGKWPTIDLYVELLPDDNGVLSNAERMFCFVQVKATTLGYLKRSGNLRVAVSNDDLNRLANYHGPTYLIGIDLNATLPTDSKAYIEFIKPSYNKALSSLSVSNELDAGALIRLYDEVIDFWNSTDTLPKKTSYTSVF